jgi:hypothetical protein
MKRNLTKRLLTINLVLLFIGLLNSSFILECDCLGQSFDDALKTSNRIFTGTVRELQYDPSSCWRENDCIVRIATIEIIESFTESLDTVKVHTMTSTASCGIPFELGQKYLVYSQVKNDTTTAFLCSRTMILNSAEASADISRLRTLYNTGNTK